MDPIIGLLSFDPFFVNVHIIVYKHVFLAVGASC